MKDEPLLKLKDKIKELESKDASYVCGFMSIHDIVMTAYEEGGTPLQKSFLAYLNTEAQGILKIKTDHGKFKHIVK